jgi:hypothetical protein
VLVVSVVLSDHSHFTSRVQHSIFYDCFTLEMKALYSFETSETTYPTRQRHIPGDLELQQNIYKNLRPQTASLLLSFSKTETE